MFMTYRTKDIIHQTTRKGTRYDITPTYNPQNKSEVWVFVNQMKKDSITGYEYTGTVAQYYFDTIERAQHWINVGDFEAVVNWWAS